ncbi:BTAD domain-containing putative transcriptional regulator [Yinghuangia soli]|uniref:AAA family ATPase n=1 Tax=Yinghuangia soli TaxID=2908204 RepID=A0AA41Q3N7_9ACTN|nr:BTAD domain-containing putative transcriptional regulator [Yinghuangia soli]MCF2530963.1 AAA family ATPase [Yinghuangia soli]
MVHIQVLGSLIAERNGEAVPLGGRRQRSVLALLVAHRGQVVSVDRMIDDLWQGAPPAQAVTSLQAYVSNLRRLLEPGRAPRTPAKLLVSAPPGYALRLPDDAVDAWRFEHLLHDARTALAADGAGAAESARAALTEALGLWRGPAYAESADESWAVPEAARLGELRLVARELRTAAELRCTDPAAAVPEAELLTREAPLREEGWRLHALALWAAGRQADALGTLRRARAVLAAEVGLDPGPALTALEAAILAQDTALLQEATRAGTNRRPGPRNGPPDAANPEAAASPAPRPEPDAARSSARRPGPPDGTHSTSAATSAPPAASRPEPQARAAHPSGLLPAPQSGAHPGPAPDLVPRPDSAAAPPSADGPTSPYTDLFVGRDAESAQLVAAADRARSAGPTVALVTGEAGLGKSALLRAFGAHLERSGRTVVFGRTTDAEGAPPAWAWVEALRGLAREFPPPEDSLAVLAPLLPDAAAHSAAGTVHGPGSDSGPGADRNSGSIPGPGAGPASGFDPGTDVAAGRFRLHRAVWRWLAGAAAVRPLVIVLDDLHWADQETGALLAGLADVPAGTPLMVVAAFRPDELAAHMSDTLAALAGRSPVRVALSGLPAAAVAEVVAAAGGPAVDAETLAALAERTGGNPFYLRESARLLAGEGALVALAEVPDGVRDVLRRRLGRLPEAAVAVLRLAAVAGREADVEVLLDAADTDEDGVLGALEAGLIAGLLVEPAPGRVRFVHALVRDTLLADLTRLRATRMHARIAASLEARASEDVSALAHHFAAAASSATAAKAVAYCVRAAALAENRYAHDAAAASLADALACFDRIPAAERVEGSGGDRAAERVALLGRLLRAQVRAGAVVDARETRRMAVEHAVADGRDGLLTAALTAWTEPTPWQTRPYGGIDEPVVAQLRRLLARPDHEPALRCRLLLAYAEELSNLQDPSVRAAATEAVALADEAGDPSLRAQARATLLREFDPDREWREAALIGAELERLGIDHDLPGHRWHGQFAQASAAAVEGDAAASARRIEECLRVARAYRMPGPVAVAECAVATLAHIEGRTEEAEQLYAQAAAAMARQGSPHADGYLLMAMATIRAGQGRLAEFVPIATQLYDEYGPLMGDLLAAALAAAGRTGEARALLAKAGPIQADFFFKVSATFRAMAMVAAEDPTGAAELYDALLPSRESSPPVSGFSLAIPPIAATLAGLADLLDRPAEAAAHRAHAAAIAAKWNTALGVGS